MNDFIELYDVKNLVRVPTCYKNPENLSCIDLFLTNKNLCFQDTDAFETELSDFHKLVVMVMKTYFRKMKPKTIRYRSYKTLTIMHSDQLFKINLSGETQTGSLKV